MNRNPAVDCTDQRCPFVDWPHTVERVPGVPVDVHYTVDPEMHVITILWIHSDDMPWPDETARAEIRRKHDAEAESESTYLWPREWEPPT